MRVIYFVDNKQGGITSLNYNLVSNNPFPDEEQWVIHIDHKETLFARANRAYPADKELFFNYPGKENTYRTIRQLRQLLPSEAGALVLNDALEMQMLDHYEVPQTIYQLVHDEYNLTLARQYGHIVDVFIAHSRFFYEALKEALPERQADIHYLPHGVSIPAVSRTPVGISEPLRLLFLGRMNKTKGIFDLPLINDQLRANKVPFSWTCIGSGPDLETLKAQWNPADPVTFCSPATNEEVIAICAKQDVFVLPTRFEGSPVSLLETMSVGLVPVITDLPGGIQEIVGNDIGYRLPMKDSVAFAAAIQALHEDRNKLRELSINCREKVTAEFNVVDTAARYHALFNQYRMLYRTKQQKRLKIGARLDQPWMPSALTRLLRTLKRSKNL